MPLIHSSRKATLLLALPMIAGLAGCHEHFGAPHNVVHGQPRSVFANPVGYAYPDIKNRTRMLGYRPLPTPTQRPLGVIIPPSTPPPAATPPSVPRKQSRLAPKPSVAPASEPTKPTVEIVPRQDATDGRATTQSRR